MYWEALFTAIIAKLRAVPTRRAETERRFWLGRPYDDLRRAVAGRSVTALVDGFLEIS